MSETISYHKAKEIVKKYEEKYKKFIRVVSLLNKNNIDNFDHQIINLITYFTPFRYVQIDDDDIEVLETETILTISDYTIDEQIELFTLLLDLCGEGNVITYDKKHIRGELTYEHISGYSDSFSLTLEGYEKVISLIREYYDFANME